MALVASLVLGGTAAGATAGAGAAPRDERAGPSAAPSAEPSAVEPVSVPVPDGPEPEASIAVQDGGEGAAADPSGTRGAPVDPTPVTLTQPDGSTLTARRWGDGVLNGYEDLAGYTIAEGPSGSWVYAEGVDRAGDLVLGSRVAGRDAPPPAARPADPIRPADPGPLPTPAGASGPTGAPHAPHTGVAPTLVILTQFSDRASLGSTAAQWRSAFFGASSSVADYYANASYGALDVEPAAETSGTSGDGIVGWVTVPRAHPNTGDINTTADYQNVNGTARDAVLAADPFVDFAAYDDDSDGSIEPSELHVVVITAGYEASSGCAGPNVWGHRWSVYHATPPVVDGTTVAGPAGGYTMFGERHCMGSSSHMATIGIMVHELGHDLGWPDLYDTTYATAGGVGRWSVMAAGSWNAAPGELPGSTPPLPDPFLRSLQGWVTPTEVSGASQAVVVPAATSSSTVYRVLANPGGVDWAMQGWGTQSGTGEYFLIENRQLTGWDAGLPGCGILVWHIDETRSPQQPNNTAARRLVQLEQADGLGHMNGDTNVGDGGDPYPGSTGNTSFALATNPNTVLYSGAASGVSVTVPAGACSASKTVSIATTGTPPPTAPVNDAFASATLASGATGAAGGTNVDGTKQAGEPDHAGNDGGASVWWRWTAPRSGQLFVSTAGSSFDTVLAVYTGSSVGSLTERASNDDTGGLTTSQVGGIAVTSGTTYRIAVDGYDGGSGAASGSVALSWWMPATVGPTPFASWGAYVDRQCLDFFGGPCTADSRAEWVAFLTTYPTARGELVRALRETAHHTTYVDPVARLYRAFYLRHPDRSGLQYWIGQRSSGKGLFWIANFFASSAEFRTRYGSLSNRQFVELVYTNVLGRLGEQSGMDFWTAELAAGRRTRGAVMVGFSESSEYRSRSAIPVNLSVITLMMLRRPPTDVELTYWQGEAAGGRMDAALVAEWILISPEYDALV